MTRAFAARDITTARAGQMRSVQIIDAAQVKSQRTDVEQMGFFEWVKALPSAQ